MQWVEGLPPNPRLLRGPERADTVKGASQARGPRAKDTGWRPANQRQVDQGRSLVLLFSLWASAGFPAVCVCLS